MLAPNGQTFFPTQDDWETTYERARAVLERCTDHFEDAVEGKPLKFTLNLGDNLVLSAMHGEHARLLTGQFYLFINRVLSIMRMPYRISTVACSVTNDAVMYCSIKRETFDDIKLRIGEVG